MFNKRIRTTRCIEYAVVFFGFFMMFFFAVPQSDIFLFAHATDGSFASALQYSVNIGNGRLLGNITGVYFSSHFALVGLITAATLTLLVLLLNRIFLEDNVYTILPLALLVAFPSTGMLKECYYLFSAFCNFVIPIVFVLISALNEVGTAR